MINSGNVSVKKYVIELTKRIFLLLGKLLKEEKEEKEKLIKKKEAMQETYCDDRDQQKELNTVCSNVNAILGQPDR